MLTVTACRMTSSEPLCIGFSTKPSKDYRQFCSPAFKYNPAVRIRVPKMHSVIAVIIQHGAVVKEMKFLCFAKADETTCRSGVFNCTAGIHKLMFDLKLILWTKCKCVLNKNTTLS